LTLPNILKEFNKNLYGYATKKIASSSDSMLNVAVTGSMSKDMMTEAKNLISLMKKDKKVDIQKHWKLITILFGANDFCEICKTKNQTAAIETASNELLAVLRFLQSNLSRTLINVVSPPDVATLLNLTNRPIICKMINPFVCPCIFSLIYKSDLNKTVNSIQLWYQMIRDVINLPEFHKDDVRIFIYLIFL
jgi:hypothetical protein